MDCVKAKAIRRGITEYLPDKRVIQATIGRQVITNTTQNTINNMPLTLMIANIKMTQKVHVIVCDAHQQSRSKPSKV